MSRGDATVGEGSEAGFYLPSRPSRPSRDISVSVFRSLLANSAHGKSQSRRSRHRLARSASRPHLFRTPRRWTWSNSPAFTTRTPKPPAKSPRNTSCTIFASIAEAAAASDALNIVTPTTTHFEIAKQLLAAGQTRPRRKTDDRQFRTGRRVVRTGAAEKSRPASRPRRTVQSGFQISRRRRHRAEVHRMPPAVAVSRPLARTSASCWI